PQSTVDCGGSCDPCPVPCTDNEITLSINLDNYPEETSWQVTDGSGTVVASGGTYGAFPDGSNVTEEICLVDGCYDFTILDSYGDGICCSYGVGDYTLADATGNVLASGASFGNSETTNFCVGGGSQPTCTDGIQNGQETGVDCGGPDCPACPTCTDGIQNGQETDVDCGGPDCPACPTCNDGIQNGQETGVDCGGPDCPACPTCDDGIQNGQETGVDCGGPDCPACPTCNDGIQNGQETGVDCGGPDCPACPQGCNANEVVITILLDNYPEETSWDIQNGSGNVLASGGTYGSQPDGSTVTEIACLADGCYTFTIYDSFGDGICCAYGIGNYSVTSNGTVLAAGAAFRNLESTDFCLGQIAEPSCTDGIQNGQETDIDCGGPDCPACPTCDDGILNGNETDVDCGGPDCPACPTCTDGIQNGQETGVDCGGPDCPACPSGGSEVILGSFFETGWDGWQDGGADCFRYSGTRSYEGQYSIRLRDNSSSSIMTSAAYDVSGYTSLDIEFYFYPNSMETGEDFFVNYFDGSSWLTLAAFASGSDFSNGSFYVATVSVNTSQANFPTNAQFRFQCDASTNSDQIYIDAVTVTGNFDGSGLMNNGPIATSIEELGKPSVPVVREESIDLGGFEAKLPASDLQLFPNPASDQVSLLTEGTIQSVRLLSATGQQIRLIKFVNSQSTISVADLQPGVYYLMVEVDGQLQPQRFVKQ
ncbi:MAG: T9SS type A sorting domain-containing protein, partial [Bacteroidota bacterium]